MSERDFYITLISSSSNNIYPSNTTSCFNIQLPRDIQLSEEAVVGLAEIHFPYNFFNVTDENNRFSFIHGDYIFNGNITTGFYKTVSELISAILKETQDDLGDWLQLESETNRTKVIKTKKIQTAHPKSKDKESRSRGFYFHDRLAIQLGFPPNENVFKFNISPYVGNIYFGIPNQMLVYCDIIEPQIIGYESSQVLKIINSTESEVKFGTPCYREFHKIHYIPVLKNKFDSIEINIRDISGYKFPFRHGVVMVKLHFKDRKKTK